MELFTLPKISRFQLPPLRTDLVGKKGCLDVGWGSGDVTRSDVRLPNTKAEIVRTAIPVTTRFSSF